MWSFFIDVHVRWNLYFYAMMKLRMTLILILGLSGLLTASPLDIQDILKGEDSAVLRSYLNVYKEYAAADRDVRLLDIILDTDGLSSARKAQNYIRKYGTEAESNWLLLLLADYYISSGNVVLAGGILDKALRRDPNIAEDRYYILIKSRIDGSLPDAADHSRDKKPAAITLDLNEANKILAQNDVLIDRTVQLPGVPDKEPVKQAQKTSLLYHLQIGAFSRKANAENRRDYFLREGYPAVIRVRATESGTMYVVWVGDYPDRESAQSAREFLLKRYSTDSFIVKD